MQISIRAGQERDTTLLLELFDEAVAWLAARGQIGQWGSEPFSASAQRRAMIRGFVDDDLWVAEIHDQGVGAIVLGSAPAHVSAPTMPELFVSALVSSRVHSGVGIGTRLIEHAVVRARQLGRRQLRVDCWAESPSLVGFYQNVGFQKTETYDVRGWKGQVLRMGV